MAENPHQAAGQEPDTTLQPASEMLPKPPKAPARPPPPVKVGIEGYHDYFNQTYPKASPEARSAAMSLSQTLLNQWNTGSAEAPQWHPAAMNYGFDAYLSDVVALAQEMSAQQYHLGIQPEPAET